MNPISRLGCLVLSLVIVACAPGYNAYAAAAANFSIPAGLRTTRIAGPYRPIKLGLTPSVLQTAAGQTFGIKMGAAVGVAAALQARALQESQPVLASIEGALPAINAADNPSERGSRLQSFYDNGQPRFGQEDSLSVAPPGEEWSDFGRLGSNGDGMAPPAARKAPAESEPVYRPRAAVRGLGVAAAFAGLIPAMFGVALMFDPSIYPLPLAKWIAPVFAYTGITLLIFSARVIARMNPRKYPTAPGDTESSSAEFAGFILGLASNLFWPHIMEGASGRGEPIPENVLIAAGIMATAAVFFLGMDFVKNTHANRFSQWLTLLGHGAGVGLMIYASTTHNSVAILAGILLTLAVTLGSHFINLLWKPIASGFQSLGSARVYRGDLVLSARPAVNPISMRNAGLLGLAIAGGATLFLAMLHLIPGFVAAFLPFAGLFAGWWYARSANKR